MRRTNDFGAMSPTAAHRSSSRRNTAIFLLGILAWSTGCLGDRMQMTRCPTAWSSVRSTLENVTETSLNCRFDQRCMGISCNGSRVQGSAVSAGIHIKPCDNPISVVVRANIPQLGVFDWTQTFTAESHGQIYPIPGARVKLPNDSVIEGMVQVKLQQEKRQLRLGIALKGKLSGSNIWPLSLPLVVDQEVTVPPCDELGKVRPETYAVPGLRHEVGDVGIKSVPSASAPLTADKTCDLTRLESGCGPNEICTQASGGNPDGVCKCLNGRDAQGNCLAEPTVPSVPDTSTRAADDAVITQTPNDASKSSSITVQVVVPLVVLLACSILIYVAVRMRLFHRLRAQILRVSGHEELTVGDDDEDPRRPAIA